MGEKMVKMRNPANNMVSTVSERAFEDVWKAKGFEKVEHQGEDAPAIETTGTETGETNTDQSEDESARRRRR